MLWDVEESEGPGIYGAGLAQPLGDTAFLPRLRGPLVFKCVALAACDLCRLLSTSQSSAQISCRLDYKSAFGDLETCDVVVAEVSVWVNSARWTAASYSSYLSTLEGVDPLITA